jgi:hypothetical protein
MARRLLVGNDWQVKADCKRVDPFESSRRRPGAFLVLSERHPATLVSSEWVVVAMLGETSCLSHRHRVEGLTRPRVGGDRGTKDGQA